ncbi:MAG TPA: lytic transglycosylase domain-containing protein [Thermoanaerobaculia bacterium]|nr:lytic transglycosylase domain-containing protein [Thermoanaerobaculia bacterium]
MIQRLTDPIALRFAKARRSRLWRLVASRAVATLTLGAALSVGGATEALQGVHFLVQKDLDSVRVVKSDSDGAELVADVHGGFAANSLFKLSRILPDRVVTQQISLFNDQWLPAVKNDVPPVKRDLFHTEMARLNTAIRDDFFANAVPFGDLIHEKAQKYDVDPALVAAVIETESRFHPQARSSVGARGLMQLMPRTGRWLGATNLYDPEQNIDAGVRYLKYLQDRFDGNLKKAIAAYNGGEGNVERYGGVPPFHETRMYVKKVLSRYEQRQRQIKAYEQQAPAAAGTPEGVATLR